MSNYIENLSEKVTLVGDDKFIIADSENSNINKFIKESTLKNAILPPVADIPVSNFATEGYFNVAKIPDSVEIKSGIFTIQAVTPLGTKTETVLAVAIAHRLDNTGAIIANVSAVTAHSYSSDTTAENGYVIKYATIHYSSGYWYLALYKYNNSALTIKILNTDNQNWEWVANVTAVSAIGSFSRTVTLASGFRASQSYTDGAGYAGYSSYGVLGTDTYLLSTVDNTNKWILVADVYMAYNSSYQYGHAINSEIHIKELSPAEILSGEMYEDFIITIRASLATCTTSALFNSTVPRFSFYVRGKTLLTANDFAMVVVASSTSSKTIRLFIKASAAKKYYELEMFNRYGRSFNSTFGRTNSYCYLNYCDSGTAGLTTLPTPVQGATIYPVEVYNDRRNIYFTQANNILGTENIVLGSNNEVINQSFITGEDNVCGENNIINGSGNNSSSELTTITGFDNTSLYSMTHISGKLNSCFSEGGSIHGNQAKIEYDMPYVRAFNNDVANSLGYCTNQEQLNIATNTSISFRGADSEEFPLYNGEVSVGLTLQDNSVNGIHLKGVFIIRDDAGLMVEKCFFHCNGIIDLVNNDGTFSTITEYVTKSSVIPDSFRRSLGFSPVNFVANNYFEIQGRFAGLNALAVLFGYADATAFEKWTFDVNIWVDTVEMYSFPDATNKLVLK